MPALGATPAEIEDIHYSPDPIWSLKETGSGTILTFPDWEQIEMSQKQWDVFSYPGKRMMINAGTGFGKDWIAIFKGIDKAWDLWEERKDDKSFKRSRHLVNVAICAPTVTNYKETWDKLLNMVPHVPGTTDGEANYKVLASNKSLSIQLFGKHGILFHMVTLFDANNVRGQGWDICIITEAAFAKLETYRRVVLKRVTRGNYYNMIILISTPNPEDEWWDDACDQAIEGRGLFGDFAYFHATSYDNPTLTQENAEAMLKERDANPWEYDQERLAKLHVKASQGEGLFLTRKMLESAFYTEKPQVRNSLLAVFDLMYGGRDRLCRGIWDQMTNTLIDVRFWTSAELKIDPENPEPSIAALFHETTMEFPNCMIAYDKQGRQGGGVAAHVNRRIRLKPMTRGHVQKNAMVDDFVGRLALVDKNQKCIGIRLPDENATWLTERQRKHVKELYLEIVNYQRVFTEGRDGKPKIIYTKGPQYGDDGIDMCTWACPLLRPVRRQIHTESVQSRVSSAMLA